MLDGPLFWLFGEVSKADQVLLPYFDIWLDMKAFDGQQNNPEVVKSDMPVELSTKDLPEVEDTGLNESALSAV